MRSPRLRRKAMFILLLLVLSLTATACVTTKGDIVVSGTVKGGNQN